MKIYWLSMFENPTAESIGRMKSVDYAVFSAVGTWEYQREPCPVCEWHWQKLVEPLLVEWERSSLNIGDFSWNGPFDYTFCMKKDAAERLMALGFELDLYSIEYQKPHTKRKTVPFPFNGPPLVWVKTNRIIDLDEELSGVSVESHCQTCGDLRHTFCKKGVVMRRDKVRDHLIFRITTNDGSMATFVTEEGKQKILDGKFTNISFTEAGIVIP